MEQDPRYYNNNEWNNTPQPPYQPTIIVGEREQKGSSNLAVTSLVLGILSILFSILLFWIFYFAFIMGVIGIIMGIVSIAQHSEGKGLAVAGIITSVIGLLISLVLGLLIIIGLAVMAV